MEETLPDEASAGIMRAIELLIDHLKMADVHYSQRTRAKTFEVTVGLRIEGGGAEQWKITVERTTSH